MEHEEKQWLETAGAGFQRHLSFPVNLGSIENAQGQARGVGSCGDIVEIAVRLENDIIAGIGHRPQGCAFTAACASAVCALAQGRTVDDALALSPEDVARELDGLPEDHQHCARLAVNTLGEAIADAFRTAVHTGKQEG